MFLKKGKYSLGTQPKSFITNKTKFRLLAYSAIDSFLRVSSLASWLGFIGIWIMVEWAVYFFPLYYRTRFLFCLFGVLKKTRIDSFFFPQPQMTMRIAAVISLLAWFIYFVHINRFEDIQGHWHWHKMYYMNRL